MVEGPASTFEHQAGIYRLRLDRKPNIAGSDRSQALAHGAKQVGDRWHPDLLALVTEGEVDPAFRPIFGLEVEHRWEHKPGISLIGDAAHLTPPDGKGANWALYDGAKLAKAIVAHPGEVEAARIRFESDLFPRNVEASRNGHRLFEDNFGERAPDNLRRLMAPMIED